MSYINTGIAGSGASVVQTITGNSGGPVGPSVSDNINLLGAGGILVAGNAGTNTLTITGTPSVTWNEVTATSASMAVSNGYVANNAGVVTLTLPATAAFGDMIRVAGKGAGGWLIAQNAGQTIHFGSVDTTTGAGGSLASTLQYDVVELLCITQDTDFLVTNSVGNITYV